MRSICLTSAVDRGLRTLSGGQYSIQVDGYLAVEESVAPALVVEAAHSVRDVFAVLGSAADAEVRLRVDVDGAAYCTLSIPAGMTTSPAADGNVTGAAGRGREADARGAGGGTDLSGRESDGADSTLMAEQLTKLRPDRDLQCYFERPSAVAALSGASADGFTVSGCWRQQFDWAVIEWNRDNVFEHPALRNLPDGDLSGLQLSYEEVRTNCIPLDSTLYPTVDWPYLRIWAESGGAETLYKVPLKNYATAVGEYTDATVEFELQGTPTAGDYIELAWLDQHFNYRLTGGDTLESAVSALAAAITANQATGAVSADGQRHADRADLSWRAGIERKSDRRIRDGARSGDGIVVARRGEFCGRGIAGAVEGGTRFLGAARCNGRTGTDHARAEDALDVGGGFAERQLRAQRVRGGGDELAA